METDLKNRVLSPMELADTVDMMLSDDYLDRFRAEFHQTRIRYNKLREMLEKWDNGELDFTPACPREIYNVQLSSMSAYLGILDYRRRQEGLFR